MELAKVNHNNSAPDKEKRMEKNSSSLQVDVKGGDGDKKEHKEHKHKESNHHDRRKDHKPQSNSINNVNSDLSNTHKDSNMKPKENHHSSSSKDLKLKTNSISSKPKEGQNNSISKPKDPTVLKSSESKGSSSENSLSKLKDGNAKPKENSNTKHSHNKPKDATSKNNINKTKDNSTVSKPKENSVSSNKPKENSTSSSSSSKPKESSSKPKESSSKTKESSGSSNTSNKPKDSSNSINKSSTSIASSSSKSKESGEKHGGNSSLAKPKSSTEKQGSSSSVRPKSSGDKFNSNSNNKVKDGSIKNKDSKDPKVNAISSEKTDDKKGSSSGSKNIVISERKIDKPGTEIKINKEDEKKHRDKENQDKKEPSKDKHKESSSSHKDVKEKLKERPKENVENKDKSEQKIKFEHKLSSEKSKIQTPSKEQKHDQFEAQNSNASPNVGVKKVPLSVTVKREPLSDDDLPLAVRKAQQERKTIIKKEPTPEIKREKRHAVDDDSEDEPLAIRLEKAKKLRKADHKSAKKRKADVSDDEPMTKKVRKETENKKTHSKTGSPTKRKKEEETQEVWKWWEEEKYDGGVKWKALEHKGPVFAPDYEQLPRDVKFFYDGKHVELSSLAEEVATFYARLLDHDYTTKEAFNRNFFKDWRKTMTAKERELITNLKLCNFSQMHKYFLQKTEERKNMTKEEKLVIKKANEEMQKEYGFCVIDGHKEKIGNFKIEPPGLFRGRGEHPKMGKLKKRTMPEDVTINCGKKSKVPKPPEGRKWKEVRHDDTVTWLACWQENVQGQTKYVMLNPSSKLKGEKDWQKYEIARKLKSCVDRIREQYRNDWKSKEMKVRQRAVALYFIDKLALRAGNEKEEGESADTVGCCSLRVEHITLDEEKDGQEYVVSFDFLGKDSIRYENSVPVEKRVFKNVQLFMENKQPGDDLFDRLNTAILNKHLNELMDGLTAKVFRTYNASKTLQEQLALLTNASDPIPAKILSYNRANRAVAVLCNHQRAVPKTFDKSMGNLQGKINAKRDQVKEAEKELKSMKKSYKNSRAEKDRSLLQRKEKALERLKDQLVKLELQATDKEENKQIALGTSKLNYLDPRITVAWCKKWDVPIEKVYNRTQRDKFRWAIEMAGPDFVF